MDPDLTNVGRIEQDVEVVASDYSAPYVKRWALIVEVRDLDSDSWDVFTIADNGDLDVGHLGLLEVAAGELLNTLTVRDESDA